MPCDDGRQDDEHRRDGLDATADDHRRGEQQRARHDEAGSDVGRPTGTARPPGCVRLHDRQPCERADSSQAPHRPTSPDDEAERLRPACPARPSPSRRAERTPRVERLRDTLVVGPALSRAEIESGRGTGLGVERASATSVDGSDASCDATGASSVARPRRAALSRVKATAIVAISPPRKTRIGTAFFRGSTSFGASERP